MTSDLEPTQTLLTEQDPNLVTQKQEIYQVYEQTK